MLKTILTAKDKLFELQKLNYWNDLTVKLDSNI